MKLSFIKDCPRAPLNSPAASSNFCREPKDVWFLYTTPLGSIHNCVIVLFRTVVVEAARADAEKIRLVGGADASAIEAVGKAEAERMRLKASAYKQYGNAAMLSLVLETLPKVSEFSC